LQARQLEGNFDVGTVQTNELVTLVTCLGPLDTSCEIEVPLWRCTEFGSAIPEKGISPGTNLVCERNDESPAATAKISQIWLVIRNDSEAEALGSFEPP
jgi:hypothetical protein